LLLSSINANFVTHNEETNPHLFVPVLNAVLSRSLLKEKSIMKKKNLENAAISKIMRNFAAQTIYAL